MIPLLAFDIDGVVADIQEEVISDICEYANCKRTELDFSGHNIGVPGIADDRIILEIATQATVNHWETIKPYPGSIHFIKTYYKKIKRPVTFLTARQGADVKVTTYAWLQMFLHEIEFVVSFRRDKNSFFEEHQQYTGIVEDRLHIVNNLPLLKDVFLVNREWNLGRDATSNVTRISKLNDIWKYVLRTAR